MKQYNTNTIIAAVFGVGAIILVALKWKEIKAYFQKKDATNEPTAISENEVPQKVDYDGTTGKDCNTANAWIYKLKTDQIKNAKVSNTRPALSRKEAIASIEDIVIFANNLYGNESAKFTVTNINMAIEITVKKLSAKASIEARLRSAEYLYERTCV